MFFVESKSNDPGWNLALEEFLVEKLQPGESCLYLWQNDNTVVVGKNQNTLAQINAEFVRENKISVCRRLSGGGAVYHDLGNLCFTWITDAKSGYQIDFSAFCDPIVAAIRKLGADAELSGRNDILVDGKKISGNSQYFHGGKVIHHGTILFCTDLSKLAMALRVDRSKICDKGIASVSARVTNLQDLLPQKLSLARFRDELVAHVFETIPMETVGFTPADMEQIGKLKKERYDTWEWNYGMSPEYSDHQTGRIPGCGMVEVYTTVRQGLICDIRICGDYFENQDVSELERQLVGCAAKRESIEKKLDRIDAGKYISGVNNTALSNLITPI